MRFYWNISIENHVSNKICEGHKWLQFKYQSELKTENLVELRDKFNILQKRPIKILFGYVAGTASNNHRFDHWLNFQTSKMTTTASRIKVKSYFNERENKMVPVKDMTISRESCKIILYCTINPKNGVTFESVSNIGK